MSLEIKELTVGKYGDEVQVSIWREAVDLTLSEVKVLRDFLTGIVEEIN